MYPLLLSAFWYGCVVLLKTVSSDEMLDNLRFMFEGILLRMLGGFIYIKVELKTTHGFFCNSEFHAFAIFRQTLLNEKQYHPFIYICSLLISKIVVIIYCFNKLLSLAKVF